MGVCLAFGSVGCLNAHTAPQVIKVSGEPPLVQEVPTGPVDGKPAEAAAYLADEPTDAASHEWPRNEIEAVASPSGPMGAEIPVAPLDPASNEACQRPPAPPLPIPGSASAADFWQAFRAPLAPAPVWDPPGRKRVGLQAGHWRVEEAPEELRRLGHGSSGGGRAEWEVNLDIAQRTAELLRRADLDVDIIPATLPASYRAHVFLSIHADGDESGMLRGFKLARPGFSATPEADDRVLAALYESYGRATGLPRDDLHISRRMTAYYAFNSRRYCHAVAPGVPSAILEAGFLTSSVDRQLLLGNPNAAARGIAEGVLHYLAT